MEQDTETKIIKECSEYIKEKSIFGETIKVLPETPQSFASFPTIIIKEMYDNQNVNSTSTTFYETASNLTYQVDMYTQAITIGNKKYQARNVISELKILIFDFFMKHGFVRASGTRGEYPDKSIIRYVCLFNGTKNNWNGKIR